MSPSDISSCLSTNIFPIGISSLTPMMYLSMDTIKSASNADRTKNFILECFGIYAPQSSICIFLLIMMFIKVLIAPLSTTTFTTNELIKLNLPAVASSKAPFSASPSSSTSTSSPIWMRGKQLITSGSLQGQQYSLLSYLYS